MLFSFLKAKASQTARKLSSAHDPLAPYEEIVSFFDKEGLYPDFPIITHGVNEPLCKIDGREYLMFCSNNYLSLTEDSEVKKAAAKSLTSYGLGPGGSRAVSGTIDVIVELEKKIAQMVGAEDCLTFPTGYMANVGVFKALMDSFFNGLPHKTEDSVIFSDEFNHGSIVDGCRLSRAKKVVFKHNDLADLKKKIVQNNYPNKLIVTEGVFSTEGEIINLQDYIDIAQSVGALLMIDDAHGVGVLGDKGGGTPELQGVSGGIDILMGSMDKAFGGTGGYLCGKSRLIRYLRVAMSSSILSSAIPTVSASAMSMSVDKITSETGRSKRLELGKKAGWLRRELGYAGFKVLGDHSLPAIPLLIGDEERALTFYKKLLDKGIFTSVFRWPAVPQGAARLRLTLMSSHSQENLERLVTSCREVGGELGVI